MFPYFDFVDTLGVETNPTATKSTNIGFDFVDTLLVHSSVQQLKELIIHDFIDTLAIDSETDQSKFTFL